MTRFETGRTYWTRSPGDHDCIIRVTVAARTAATLTTREGKRFRIAVLDGVERIKPWGSYSLCPVLTADRPG